MKIRKLALVSAIAIMAFAGAAQAQDNCYGLSASDCTLIESATANTLASAQSFTQNWSIDFSVNGIPDSQPVTFTATGSGPVAIDTAGVFPISFDQMVTAAFNDGTTSGGGDTQAILKDGILYIDRGNGDFGSIDINEAMTSGEIGGTSLPLDPSTLGDLANGSEVQGVMDSMAGLQELTGIDGFLVYTRNGAEFTFVADLTRLINDPSFQTTLSTMAADAGPDAQQAAAMGSMLPMLLSKGTITVVQTVDEAANIVTGIDFTVDASINASMLSQTATEPIVISLAFSVDLSDVNAAAAIEAPASSTPLEMGSGS